MEITENQICEDQIVTFKQIFMINMCDGERTITHMQTTISYPGMI